MRKSSRGGAFRSASNVLLALAFVAALFVLVAALPGRAEATTAEEYFEEYLGISSIPEISEAVSYTEEFQTPSVGMDSLVVSFTPSVSGVYSVTVSSTNSGLRYNDALVFDSALSCIAGAASNHYLVAGETYYIQVSYVIEIYEEATAALTVVVETAAPTQAVVGQGYTFEIESVDVAYGVCYVFVPKASGEYTFTFSGEDSFWAYMNIVDSSGSAMCDEVERGYEYVSATDEDDGYFVFDSATSVTLDLTAGETYYILLYAYSADAGPIVSFEITTDLAIEDVDYSVTEGADQTLEADGESDLVVTADGALAYLTELQVDGEALEPGVDYTVASGSTVATLSADYLATLEAGEHTLTFVYVDGSCSTTFTILASETDEGDDGADESDESDAADGESEESDDNDESDAADDSDGDDESTDDATADDETSDNAADDSSGDSADDATDDADEDATDDATNDAADDSADDTTEDATNDDSADDATDSADESDAADDSDADDDSTDDADDGAATGGAASGGFGGSAGNAAFASTGDAAGVAFAVAAVAAAVALAAALALRRRALA